MTVHNQSAGAWRPAGPYHVIEAPDWVTVVPLTRDGQRLLTVRKYRHGVRAVLTGLPGGLVDPGDGNDRAAAAEAAARRELWEETGYSGGRIEHLAAVYPNPSNQTNTAYCFLAMGLVRRALPQPGGPGEVQEVTETDLVGVMGSLRDGTATMHAVHVAALWSAAARIAADGSGRFGSLPARLGQFLAGEVSLVLMPPVYAALAFRSGAVDAWAVWDPYVSLEVLQFGARVLVDGCGLTPAVMLVAAHEGAIAGKYAALDDFLGRFRAAWAWADGHIPIPEYARYNAALTGLPEPVLRRTYETERSRPVALTPDLIGELQTAAGTA